MTAGRRARLAKAQDGMCPECKLPLPEDLSETEIDHIIPRARGGPNVAWNKQLVHFACNRSKWTRFTPEAEALAKEHGITVHLPIFASAHANRPFTQEESLWIDRLAAIFYPPQD
jgi:5-methylcytosine-specific restriction endonuclease McrA